MMEQRTFSVEFGEVMPQGSWVYVWVDTTTKLVAYIGATAFEPELRARIHMTHPDPRMGRVKNEVPESEHRSFIVRAFSVPDETNRAHVKSALQQSLVRGEELPEGHAGAFAAQIIDLLRSESTVR